LQIFPFYLSSVFSSPVSGKRQYTYSSVWTVLSC
jgi:hypothetical protein